MNVIATIDNFIVPPLVAAVCYTSPPGAQSVFQRLLATNQDAANAHFLTLYKVPPGGAPGHGNIIIDGLEIAPATGTGGTDIPLMINHVLEPGWQLWAVIEALALVLLNGATVEVS